MPEMTLLDRATSEPATADWIQAGYTYEGKPDAVALEARRRIAVAVARVILEEPASADMIEAGDIQDFADEVFAAMSAARLAALSRREGEGR